MEGTGDRYNPQGYIPSDLLPLSRSRTFRSSEPPEIAPWLGMSVQHGRLQGTFHIQTILPAPSPCLHAMGGGVTGMAEASRTVQCKRPHLSNRNKSGGGEGDTRTECLNVPYTDGSLVRLSLAI